MNTQHKLAKSALLFFVTVCLSCFGLNNADSAASKTGIENPFKIENSVYEKLLKASVMSYGNNCRLKYFLNKLKNGEDVYIACLGGSVTEGAGPANYKDGYAYKFCDSLKKRFSTNPPAKDGTNIHFVNAGLSGTPSPLGLVRYEQDVVKALGHKPDLLIVEFAVNDGGEYYGTGAFEQILRGALRADKDTAVIALYSAAQYRNAQASMHVVSEYYNVPEISIQNAFNARNNLFSAKQFYTDVVHPTKEGHAFASDCIMSFLIETENRAEDKCCAVPEKYLKSPSFSGFKQILHDDENVKIDVGSFKYSDSQTQSTKQSSKGNFPNNWYHLPSSKTEPFIIKINCKNLLFVYKENAKWNDVPFGSAEVYVDGKKVAVFNEAAANGWNNSKIALIIDEETAGLHEVKVVPQKNKAFTIVALGYSK
ncbi:MAG: SGNH/GDSL hydrolase family protein [Spirochaetaceae bacterium]|nr:SGNH/GDSL hydrolase family protein [Spirochaetaceae bacterium]